MLPKDLTPQIINKLKQTAKTYQAGQVPDNFDPNNFVFHSNNGLTVMLTFDARGPAAYWLLSMSYPTRPPREDESNGVAKAFFSELPEGTGRVQMPAGTGNPNIVYFRIAAE